MESQVYYTLNSVLNDNNLVSSIINSKILIVGSGGIGVEIVKNVVLLGFKDITLIDLDTIDVSNLNRQFLFNTSHIGKSKSLVAADVSLQNFAKSRDQISLKAIHKSIISPEFDLDFFKSFKVVINALDNRSARSHVNRMCLHANVPLIESGSEGYLGQVFLIKRDVSACYECDGPRQDQKTYASCTIRNTPSLPIHCIVWGKHLFAQLFGEEDVDNDVSPDMSDPELTNKNDTLLSSESKFSSTREWAKSNNYDPKALFDKLFKSDIEYLLKMTQLWENRRKPSPLTKDKLEDDSYNQIPSSSKGVTNGTSEDKSLKDQQIWSLKECYEKFCHCVLALQKRLKQEVFLVWDKDDDISLDFVTVVSNLRSFCFGIERKSRFDVKSMAGNIIPAISSTNSIIGGIITIQLLHLLKKLSSLDSQNQKEIDNKCKETCKVVYLKQVSLSARNLISSYALYEPNPNCLVCSSGRIPSVEISCKLDEVTMCDFAEQILFKSLNFVCPDVRVEGTSSIIWSKDSADDDSEEEKQAFKKKTLLQYPHVRNKTRLLVDDLLSSQKLFIDLKNEIVDPKENDGLFYKMRVISEGIKHNEENHDRVNDFTKADDSCYSCGNDEITNDCIELDDEIEVSYDNTLATKESILNSTNDKRKIEELDGHPISKKLKTGHPTKA